MNPEYQSIYNERKPTKGSWESEVFLHQDTVYRIISGSTSRREIDDRTYAARVLDEGIMPELKTYTYNLIVDLGLSGVTYQSHPGREKRIVSKGLTNGINAIIIKESLIPDADKVLDEEGQTIRICLRNLRTEMVMELMLSDDEEFKASLASSAIEAIGRYFDAYSSPPSLRLKNLDKLSEPFERLKNGDYNALADFYRIHYEEPNIVNSLRKSNRPSSIASFLGYELNIMKTYLNLMAERGNPLSNYDKELLASFLIDEQQKDRVIEIEALVGVTHTEGDVISKHRGLLINGIPLTDWHD